MEEAEVTPGTRPPLVIVRQTESVFLQNSVDILFGDTILFEWIFGFNVAEGGSLRRFVADAVFVGADSDVVIRAVFANVFLKGSYFEVNGAPAESETTAINLRKALASDRNLGSYWNRYPY